MNITSLSIALAAAVANGIAQSQTTGGAGALTLNGSLVSAGVATLDVPRRVAIASTGNLSSINFVITGTDRYGNAQIVTIAGPNNNTVYTNQDFATVSAVTVSATVGTAVTVGTNQVASTQWYPCDWRHAAAILLTIVLSNTPVMTYTVEFTPTDISGVDLGNVAAMISNLQNAVALPSTDPNVVNASATQTTNFINPPPAIRLTVNTYTSGTATMTMIQTNTKTS